MITTRPAAAAPLPPSARSTPKSRQWATCAGLLVLAISPRVAAQPAPEHGHHQQEAHHGRHAAPAAHKSKHVSSHKSKHMVRTFKGAERWAKRFEDPKRDAWQKPDAVIRLLGLKPEMSVLDIGSATGYFTVRLARAVPRGQVWGADIEPGMIKYLNRRARQEKLENLQSVLAAPDRPAAPRKVDLIFICNTYHHIQRRSRYFARALPLLKPGGRLVVVDFKGGKLPMGPPERHRVSPRQLTRELKAAGFRSTALDHKTLPYQYIATYEVGPRPKLAPARK